MAFAEDLLEQAYHLARRERTKPRQASLRRAISTAYYALFHLLIREATGNWKRDVQRARLARTFEQVDAPGFWNVWEVRPQSNRLAGVDDCYVLCERRMKPVGGDLNVFPLAVESNPTPP